MDIRCQCHSPTKNPKVDQAPDGTCTSTLLDGPQIKSSEGSKRLHLPQSAQTPRSDHREGISRSNQAPRVTIGSETKEPLKTRCLEPVLLPVVVMSLTQPRRPACTATAPDRPRGRNHRDGADNVLSGRCSPFPQAPQPQWMSHHKPRIDLFLVLTQMHSMSMFSSGYHVSYQFTTCTRGTSHQARPAPFPTWFSSLSLSSNLIQA